MSNAAVGPARRAQRIVLLLAIGLLIAGCERVAESEGIRPRVPEAAAPPVQLPTADRPVAPTEAEQPAAAAPEQQREYRIYRGVGEVVGEPVRSQALAQVGPDGDVTLNFVDADVREVLKATLGGILGLNYVVAPQVQGTITVQSGRPIPRASLLSTLETVLEMQGVAIVREGALYRIEPLPGAARGNAAIRLGMAAAGEGEGYGVQVVPLYFISATQMADVLRGLSREGAVLQVDDTRNLLILGGTRFELAAMLEAVEIFDVNWLAGMSFGLFKLDVADPGSLIDELTGILGDDRGEIMGGLVRLVRVERLNAILAVSRQPKYLEDVRTWITRLDRVATNTVEPSLHIYFVQNGRAEDLAAVLNDVFGASDDRLSDLATGQRGELAPGLEPVQLRTTATDTAAITRELDRQRQSAAEEAATRDKQPGAETAQRETAPPVRPGGTATAAEGITLGRGSRIRIVADEERNALLISATQAEYRSVAAALRQLDRRPLEVLIEVTIADVELSDRLEYGVRWFIQEGNHSLNLSGVPTEGGLNYIFDSTNADAFIDLLSSITDVQIISAPQLFVLNNQEAFLQVGDQVPVATQTSQDTSDAAAPIVSNVELRDTGVILTVTPRVNEGGLVTMDIRQEVSQVNEEATGEGSITPTISTRVINTTVAIESGSTVVLGGLIRDSKTNTKIGVPFLSAIPFLGALFRSTSDVILRNELLVMVSPRVVSDSRGAIAVTRELRQRIDELERLETKLR